MTVERVKCTDCDNKILLQTAAANGGLCGQCVKIPESLRRAKRVFDRNLASGLVFYPSQEERDSAKRSAELGRAREKWQLEPDYYKDTEPRSVPELIAGAATQASGHVFLVARGGARLNLSYNRKYGVCEYQNRDAGEFLYAYTPENLKEQVSKNEHLVQACPCCGVETLWYPSRFHIPRKLAFEVFSAIVLGPLKELSRVEWLEGGDFSYTGRGRG